MPQDATRRGPAASPQTASQTRKTSTTVATGAPPTKQLRSTPATATFMAAVDKIQTMDEALAVLRKNQMVPAAGEPTAEGLITGLHHVGVGLSGKMAWASECCIALAVYAKAVIESAVSKSLTEAVLTRFESQTKELIGTLEARVAAAGDHIAELANKLAGVAECAKEKIEGAVENIQEAGCAGLPLGESSPVSLPFSYAEAVRASLPGTTRAAQLSVVDRESIRARQILIDGFPGNRDGTLLETEILEQANDALDYLSREELDVPEGLRFTAAKALRNGGVVLELATPDLAKWIVQHAHDYEFVLSPRAKIRPRQYKLVAEFTPVGLDPTDTTQWRQTELDLDLEEGAIVDARWIKPIHKRYQGQRFAHLLVTLSSPEAANKVIRAGLVLAGRHVSVRKNLAEPLRCSKCQRYDAGHLAKGCPQDHDTCGTCARTHRTADCKIQDVQQYHCVNCNEKGHAAWDRECPVFLDHLSKLNARCPENHLQFYPTGDPDSWVPKLHDRAVSATRVQLKDVIEEEIEKGRKAPSQRARAQKGRARTVQMQLPFGPATKAPG